MKERGILIVLCLFAGVLTWYFQQEELPSESVDSPADPVVLEEPVRVSPSVPVVYPKATPPAVDPRAPGRPALLPPDPKTLRPFPPHPEAVSIGSGVMGPEAELAVLADLFRLYRESMGSLPVGENNRQMMNALRGNNPNNHGFFPLEHDRLKDGELVDAWGTPLFFHALSKHQIEIRSAGPDRNMYTDDDLISR